VSYNALFRGQTQMALFNVYKRQYNDSTISNILGVCSQSKSHKL